MSTVAASLNPPPTGALVAPADEEAVSTEYPGPQPGRRRRFSAEEKRQFIAEALSPGQSMSSVGRRHGLSVSLLFRWRRQLDGERQPTVAPDVDGTRVELRELRDRVRELERLLGRKTHELETLQQEMARLGHGPAADIHAPRHGLNAPR